MPRRVLRSISWALVLGLMIFFIYVLENYAVEQGVMGEGAGQANAEFPRAILEKLNDLSVYEKVADNGRLALYFEPVTSSIAVEDKDTGTVWASASDVSDEAAGGSQLLKDSLKSPFNFSYADIGRPTHEVVTSNLISSFPHIEKAAVTDGISVTYRFDQLSLQFTIQFTLDDNRLVVYVPVSEIKEEGNYALVSIEPVPNLAAGTDLDEGYIFYPDGSGAISYFKTSHPQYRERYSALVYGSEDIFGKNGQRAENAYLPVFGIHKNGRGLVAYITEGEYESRLHYSPSGYLVNVNRASAEFLYRREYSAAIRRGESARRVESEIRAFDHRMVYHFLPQEYSDYSGMAGAYREYLLQAGKLHKIIDEAQTLPLALTLFMGIKEERVLKDRFVQATSFEQAEHIIQELNAAGVEEMSVIIKGWMRGGYGDYPDQASAAAELGGVSKLIKLTRSAKESGIDLFLNFNNMDANSKNLGFKKMTAVMKDPSKLPLQNYYGDSLLLNAATAASRFRSSQKQTLAGYGAAGIDFAGYGAVALADHSEWNPSTRKETVEQWLSMLQESREMNGKAAVQGGNQYVLNRVDRISDLPLEDSRYVFTDEAVPFYPMIVHGYIPYSGNIPLNIHYDQSKGLLKWVEYGSMPFYELTWHEPDELRYTEYRKLFSSAFEQWSPVIVEQYKEMNERLGFTWKLAMTSHRKLERDVYETTYEDGTRVIVNYGSIPYEVEGTQVKPLDYAVLVKEVRE
ncbi:DUF5696 domain-containing protein [Paenibacillus sp. J2TS4]|uniref:DUF5696 domain-containing protein n=1 Tax=Paenibacillus sp. J2TS4 TaxID=2807194 RepID=UPI0020C17D4D|nr:DUF5696 domain-containing protein [Paenibacillus sp. J2TS4]